MEEYSVYCAWETPDSVTNLDEIRSVEIVLPPGSGNVPSASDLETGGLELLPDARRVDRHRDDENPCRRSAHGDHGEHCEGVETDHPWRVRSTLDRRCGRNATM
ncbi:MULTISPECIES: hypothetical protein [Rhodococcus]|uniref:hypothetical protein n=1 Tax=Rhodococcus TaxID=1827 RepID=UPI000B1D0725|nr:MULTISPECIES: hypothetical protein [Rhodococcus]MCW3468651.1 hypothetical protein [Rhodococcus pyridinivorans]